MSIMQAVTTCRQNYAALASIHSWQDQQDAVSACLAMVSDPGKYFYTTDALHCACDCL